MEKKLLETNNLEALSSEQIRFTTNINVASLAGSLAYLMYPKDTDKYKLAIRHRDEVLPFLTEVLKRRSEVFTTMELRVLNNVLRVHSKVKEDLKD